MDQITAKDLSKHMVRNSERHQDYDRVVDLADEYMRLITGEEVDQLLMQFVQREDATMFEQRVRLTQSITPAVASSIMKPFFKVSRNDKIRVRHDFGNPDKDRAVNDMIKSFYGSKRKKNRGLEYWLKTRFMELSFYDPNAWIVTEWETPEANEIPQPHPFEVTSREAINFKIQNDELKWLFIETAITFEIVDSEGNIKKEPGLKYTLYDEELTLVIRQVDKRKLLEVDRYVLKADEELWEVDKNKTFLITPFYPKLGYVAAFRVGYTRDGYTKSRTYVNPFHSALPFFRKSIKTVSELDLTMTLHAFPQKLQYVEKCQGESKIKTCHGGYVNGTSETCHACKGTGYRIHTTAQDAILLPMPDDPKNSMDLNNMLVYKTPPIDLIRFQDEYTKGLKQEAHLAVFNSTVFANPEMQIAKTATEIDTNMQSIYDTLDPFTKKVSDIWKDTVFTFAHLAAVPNPFEGENVHQFPADLKLKTTSVLLLELKLVNESGAPSFIRDAIGDDLAEIIYSGDDLGYLKHSVKHRFFPFNGKTPDEIAYLLSSQYVSKFTKVFYSNFEAIFTDIEKEKPDFWVMKSYAKQWTIVDDKVNEYIEELEKQDPVRIDFGSNTDPGIDTGDAGIDPGEGDGNPGE